MSDDRTDLPTQDANTRQILTVIRERREESMHGYLDTAEAIEKYARDLYDAREMRYVYRLSGDQYRSMEQGYTKDVPLWVVIIACHVYGIGPGALLGDVLGDYGY